MVTYATVSSFLTLLLIIITFDRIFSASVIHRATSKKKYSCSINLESNLNKENSPIILSLNSSKTNYYYPLASDLINLSFSKNDKIGVFCPGQSNKNHSAIVEYASIQYENVVLKKIEKPEEIICESGNKFQFNGNSINIADIRCLQKSHSILKVHSENPRCIKGHRYEIGYDLGKNGFLRTIDLCFNETKATTLWAHAVIEPTIQNSVRYKGHKEKNFKTGVLFENMDMIDNSPYKKKTAYQTIKSILGSEEAADKYLNERKFLARGHLIANADKFYKSEQESTYFYANVVPMWQQINGNPGNWYRIEEYVRNLAFDKEHELDVWAGGIGILKLDGKEIYLYRRRNGKGLEQKIPVPMVIYKCVVDKVANEAICLLVVNNPYVAKKDVENAKSQYRVCEKLDICDNIFSQFNNPSKGYLYCCKLSDFYSKNHKELGLDEFKNYLYYKNIELTSNEKSHKHIDSSSEIDE